MSFDFPFWKIVRSSVILLLPLFSNCYLCFFLSKKMLASFWILNQNTDNTILIISPYFTINYTILIWYLIIKLILSDECIKTMYITGFSV